MTEQQIVLAGKVSAAAVRAYLGGSNWTLDNYVVDASWLASHPDASAERLHEKVLAEKESAGATVEVDPEFMPWWELPPASRAWMTLFVASVRAVYAVEATLELETNAAAVAP